ncbi:MAG: PQQ-binding-like beta-propeller repeat protein [Vicinamibacteria bacterium]
MSDLQTRSLALLILVGTAVSCSKVPVATPKPPFPAISRWQTPLDAALSAPLATDGTLAFAALSNGSIIAFDPGSGTSLWTRAGQVPGFVAAKPGFLVFVEKGGVAYGINAQDGNAQWKTTTAVRDVQSVRLDGNRIFVGGASGFASLVVSTGELRFDRPAKDVREIDTAGDAIAALEEGSLVVRGREDGRERFSLKSPEGEFGAPAIFADGRVVLGSGSRLVRQVSKNGSYGWKFKVGARVKHKPLDYLDRKRVGILSFEGVYYEVSLGGGDMRHRVLLSSRPFASPVLSDGRIWASIFEDETAVIDARTVKLIGRTKYGGSFLSPPLFTGGRLVAEVAGPRRLVGLLTAPPT